MRSSFWTFSNYFSNQLIRLASNLILTRILFPEAFGLMALISVVLIGLAMFSDLGITPSIQQSARGDDPRFLDTAWTIQIIRGVCLWLIACALAYPIALFYSEPLLTQLLPVASLILVIDAFVPTRTQTAGRHLRLGRLSALEILSGLLGTCLLVLISLFWPSVWALVVGGVLNSIITLVLVSFFLEGRRNHISWDKSAAAELVHFGKWIFLSTICGFIAMQGDRAILGKYLTIGQLGIFSIGYFWATFMQVVGGVMARNILIPVYREKPPSASEENFQSIRKMRFAFTSILLLPALFLIWFGADIINVLYDQRYHASGGVVTLLTFVSLVPIIGVTYDQIALANGDSRRFFYLSFIRAFFYISFFWFGLSVFGLIGAILFQGLSYLAVYVVLAWLAHKHDAWDPLHDAVFFGVGIGVGGMLVWSNMDAVMMLNSF